MYRPDHPPHLHAQYGEHVAQIELATRRIHQRFVAASGVAALREWSSAYAAELADNWERAQALEPVVPIEPSA